MQGTPLDLTHAYYKVHGLTVYDNLDHGKKRFLF